MWRLWTKGWGLLAWWLWFRREGFPQWVAWHLPHRIVMWCFYRVGAHATCGQWGCESPTDLKFFTAADRWDIPHERTEGRTPRRSRGESAQQA